MEEVKKEDTWALEDLYASEQLLRRTAAGWAGMRRNFQSTKDA